VGGDKRWRKVMRVLTFATLLAALFTSSSAFAQHVHHRYCLRTGGGLECAYDTVAQCRAAKTGAAQSCVRNSPTMDQH
jgi:hypothetical protein